MFEGVLTQSSLLCSLTRIGLKEVGLGLLMGCLEDFFDGEASICFLGTI